MEKLTAKQQAFIDFYKQGKTAAESARLAGYRGKNSDVIGAQNLVKLGSYLVTRDDVLAKPRIADMEEINQFWSDVVRDREEKMSDRIKASELRARSMGAFIDRVEQNGETTVRVILEGDAGELAK